MHILMVSDVYFPRINGVSTSISAFRSELQKQGHRVTLVVPAYVQAKGFDADIVRVPGRAVPGDPEDRLMSRRALRAALDRLSDRDFDVVHVQTPFQAHYAATRYARRRGLPCVETYHTFFEEYFHHYVRFLPAWLTRLAARVFTRRQAAAVDLLVVPSRAMEERLKCYGVRTRTHVLPTGLQPVDYQTADPAPFLEAHAIDAARPCLVHVGRIAHEKNLCFLLEVLDRVRRAVPDVLMLVAGEGPALESLRRRATGLGLEQNIRFLGYLGRDGELQACYAAGDVFLFSSRTETQGLVLLEAMAAGTPVVSTAVMGTRDILEAGRGALVAEDDVADFAAKVTRLLQDAELRESVSAEAKAYAREWTAGRFARELADVYRSVYRPGR
jgi:glycosyltransferase involved in cell wall biosynthesis